MTLGDIDAATWCPDTRRPEVRHLPQTQDGVPRTLPFVDDSRPDGPQEHVVVKAECGQLGEFPPERFGERVSFVPCRACVVARCGPHIPLRPTHRQPLQVPEPAPLADRTVPTGVTIRSAQPIALAAR